MNSSDDQGLVEAAKNGDKQAFAALVREYERPIYNITYRMLHDTEEARDVTQLVFLKTFENLQNFESTRKFFSWIYRIAINESINRRGSYKYDVEFDENRTSVPDNPADSLQRQELRRDLEAALMQLTPEYRSVVVLKHIAGMNYRDIARTLEVPEQTVKSRLFSARRELSKKLKRDAYL